MRIGEVIGTVTLSRVHPDLAGLRLLVAVPLSLENLDTGAGPRAEPLVVVDELGARRGSLIGFSEGREATQPFHPKRKPVDAYCACMLDNIEVEAVEDASARRR